MDKVLAFSIMSASPADISASAGYGGLWARLSWRSGVDGQQQATAAWKQQEEDSKEKQGGRDQERGARPAAAKVSLPRFAPEFDGIDCFETIVSH